MAGEPDGITAGSVGGGVESTTAGLAKGVTPIHGGVVAGRFTTRVGIMEYNEVGAIRFDLPRFRGRAHRRGSGAVDAWSGEMPIVGEPATKDEDSANPATGSSTVLDSEVPLTTTESLVPSADPGGGVGPARPRLLLVEDDWRTHSALRKILGKLGWEVHSAMTVSGGLALLGLKPDAIVLDLMLPDGDGAAVLRKVRSERLPIKVAVTTGVDDGERLDEIRRLAPDALLRKPMDLKDLLQILGIEPPA